MKPRLSLYENVVTVTKHWKLETAKKLIIEKGTLSANNVLYAISFIIKYIEFTVLIKMDKNKTGIYKYYRDVFLNRKKGT
jgi:hypothetical protein